MNCPKCGQVNPDGAQFCTNCSWNLQIEITQAPLKCQRCGELNNALSVFCSKCGAKLLKHGHIFLFWGLGFLIWILGSSIVTMASNLNNNPLDKVLAALPIFASAFFILFIPGIIVQFLNLRIKKYKIEHDVNKLKLFKILSAGLGTLIMINLLFMLFGISTIYCGNRNQPDCDQTFGCSFVFLQNECKYALCPAIVEGSGGGACYPFILEAKSMNMLLGIVVLFIAFLNILTVPIVLLIYASAGIKENDYTGQGNIGNIFLIFLALFWIICFVLAGLWVLGVFK